MRPVGIVFARALGVIGRIGIVNGEPEQTQFNIVLHRGVIGGANKEFAAGKYHNVESDGSDDAADHNEDRETLDDAWHDSVRDDPCARAFAVSTVL